MKLALIPAVLIFVLAMRAAAPAALPPASMPGETDPRVTQANLQQTVCRDESKRPKGFPTYSQSVRPSDSFTGKIKLVLMKQFNLPGKPGAYELDHLISIEIGGYPTTVNFPAKRVVTSSSARVHRIHETRRGPDLHSHRLDRLRE